MSNFFSRLIIVLIFFPLLIVLIFWLNFAHFLLFNILVIGVALLSSFEVVQMFVKKGMPVFRILAPIFAATLPLLTFLERADILPRGILGLWISAVFIIFFTIALFSRTEKTLGQTLSLIATSTFSLFYPSFFLIFLILLTGRQHPEIELVFLLGSVFLNDIAAYCFGKLARGKTRLNLAVSPNKTLIGFIAGFLTSIVVCIGFSFLFWNYYTISIGAAALLGAIIGLTTIIGDLFESALKRSCKIKDSGVLMGGRGGMMDAIDSLLLSAPVFYYLFSIFAQPV